MLLTLALAGVVLHAPIGPQTNTYRITESISVPKFGTTVLTGEEHRKIGAPVGGRRTVEITFDVRIASAPDTKAGKQWAYSELAELRASDRGDLDDLDRLTLEDGIAVDAYPALSGREVSPGDSWQQTFQGQRCTYTLSKLEGGEAVIETRSQMSVPQGTLNRHGSWTIEVATGKLLSWHLRSDVQHAKGLKESIDSSGDLIR